MQSSIPGLLKSLYAALCCGGFIFACIALVMISRRSFISRVWEPLVPVVNGTLERKRTTAILRGTYQNFPVEATLQAGGAENPDVFIINLKTVARGGDWSVEYGSDKIFGKDHWYSKASNAILQQRLDQSPVLAEMQQWQGHPTISYDENSGTLTYAEDNLMPKSERFRKQLDLLVRLARINEQVNTGSYFES